MVTVIVLGTIEAVQGNISVGEFVAFASYNTTLVWPIRGLGRILSDMSKAGVSFERVDYIISAKEEAVEKTQENITAEETYDIRFDHVNFSYEEGNEVLKLNVLKDIDFQIPQGCTFGILGGTGSGKSTIVQLLTRLYELNDGQGCIRIGGKDIRELPLRQLRSKVGMVLQEPFLYSRTILENITAACPEADKDDVIKAAKIACIHDI